MTEKNKTPNDLAKLVLKKLEGAKIPYLEPNEEVLKKLFQTLFYTSLNTEEGQFIKVTITLIDPDNPDPLPPSRKEANRWKFVSLNERIPLTVKNLVKLSKAADPWSSSLAVYYTDKNELFIWGLIDQTVHYQSFLNYESEDKPDQPGLFETSIVGIGNLIVIFDYQLIANLKQNTLISNYIDVFNHGQIKVQLAKNSSTNEKKIQKYIESKFQTLSNEEWQGEITNLMNESLCRILLKIQNYKHGGAILITKKINTDIDIKYKITYDRLYESLVEFLKLTIENEIATQKISKDVIDANLDTMPISLYLDENVTEFKREETNNEIKGAIRFISSFSCIDGLVVLTPELKVYGFGAVINVNKMPDLVYKSKTSTINEENLVEFNPNHFGTRHRSMFSYCWNNEGSIGFVVSQDGDIRAIMRVNDKLIMWENIKVQQFIRSNKLKRLFIIKKPLM